MNPTERSGKIMKNTPQNMVTMNTDMNTDNGMSTELVVDQMARGCFNMMECVGDGRSVMLGMSKTTTRPL